jgi:hypothetical protein
MLVTMSDSKPTAEWPTVFLFLLALLLVWLNVSLCYQYVEW